MMCSIAECESPQIARGWCHLHYQRWRKNGTTDLLPFAKDFPCSVAGCGAQTKTKGLCVGHYTRLRQTGDIQTEIPMARWLSDEERFWSKVNTSGECLLWTRACTAHGYGMFGFNGRMMRAHRFAWESVYGALTPDQHLLHSCDIPACVYIGHLRIGTPLENARDSIERGRHSPPPHFYGSKNPAAKLTAEDVTEARLLRVGGASAASLARRYGVSATTMKDALRGHTWAQVA